MFRTVLFSILLAISIVGVSFGAEVVNINTADATVLASNINGVGLKKAEAIIEYRSQYGNFASVDEIVKVKGIGLATLEKNRNIMTVDSIAETDKNKMSE